MDMREELKIFMFAQSKQEAAEDTNPEFGKRSH